MKENLARNWRRALADVLASVIGTLGIVFTVSIVLSFQAPPSNAWSAFLEYFSGGQLALAVLSLSGVVFVALQRHDRLGPILATILYVAFFGPVIVAAFIVGINPGFKDSVLSGANLSLLWLMFWWVHGLWFVILVLEPIVPDAQQSGKEEDERVKQIREKAAGRV